MRVIAISNQKGGVGKTTTTMNLGVGLAKAGKKVLLIDCDPQGSLTESMGYTSPDSYEITLSDLMQKVMENVELGNKEGILRHEENVDLIPANIELSGLESILVSKKMVLKEVIKEMGRIYDYVLIDCMPSLGMLAVNSLAAANSVLIPVQAHYLSAKGLEQLLSTIAKIRLEINPDLEILGILITMVDKRTKFSKEIIDLISGTYGSNINIFAAEIPMSVKAAETSAEGISIYKYDKKGKASLTYLELTEEVLSFE